MINLLIVNTVPFRMTGMTSVIINYIKVMNKDGFKIDVLVNDYILDENRKKIEELGCSIYLCKSKKKHPFKYAKYVKNLLNKNNYDIIHVHGNSSIMAMELCIAKKCDVPVRIAHSHNTTCSHMILHKLLYKSFIDACNYRFACGVEAGKWLYPNRDFKVINNGIDVNKFEFNKDIREEYRKKLNIKKEKLIVHVGNFNEQKNHSFLIDIFNEILKIDSNYKLLLIGEGILANEIKKKTNELGIEENVIFLGISNEVNNYYRAADCVVFPSLFEGLPLTLIEAQASGLPCFVSSKVSQEVKITKLINFISLNKSPNEWAKIITDYDYDSNIIKRETYKNDVVSNGYDINKNAEVLRKIYIDSVNKH